MESLSRLVDVDLVDVLKTRAYDVFFFKVDENVKGMVIKATLEMANKMGAHLKEMKKSKKKLVLTTLEQGVLVEAFSTPQKRRKGDNFAL